LVIVGPNGSGKSSIATSTGIAKNYEENIINPDNYAKSVSDIEDYCEKYIFAMKQCEILRDSLLEHRITFGFETVGSTQEKIDFVKKAATKGYVIDILFISLESAEMCYQRIQKRVERGGHDVERSKVFSRYERTMNYLKDYIEIADAIKVFDNSGKAPILVFSKNDSKMNILKNPSEIPWVEKYICPYYGDADRAININRKQ